MKILFTRFPLESAYGGAEVQTLSLMKGLAERGHTVEFVGSCPTLLKALSSQHSAVSLSVDRHGCHLLDIGPPPVSKWAAISFVWRQFGMKRKLIEKLNAECSQLNAVFMLSLSEKLLLSDWCVAHGMKVFWLEHDRVGRWLKMNPWLPKLRKLSRKTKTIVVSELSKQLYLQMGWRDEDVIAIPNGIDVEKYKSSQLTACLPAGRAHSTQLILGCVARLTKDKGVDVLIDAVKDLPNIELKIVGSGPEEASLKKQAECCMQKAVSFLPPTKTILQFYSQIDALILPSRDHDPFGLVVAEAMACGLPTICTTACGIALHLKPNESIIVPADNVQALRDGITKLFNEATYKSLAEKGLHVAEEKFSLHHMIDQYEALL